MALIHIDILVINPSALLDPKAWTREDVHTFFATLDNHRYEQYASTLGEFTGYQLIQLSQDRFQALVPGDAGLLLYGALQAREQQAESQNQESSSDLGTGAIAGIAVGIIVAIVAIVLAVVYKLMANRRRG